jgi:Flp pilus assembly protein TadG
MKAALASSRGESGQVFVFVAFILMVLVGMAALVIDVGSWYRADRQLQTAADAAALAGAQELPNEASASSTAVDYSELNDAGLDDLFADPNVNPVGDTIHVTATATAPGFFARIYGAAFNKVNLSAEAEAQIRTALTMKHVAQFVFSKDHKFISGPGCPCFDQETTAPLENDRLPGNFGIISLEDGVNPTPGELASWIQDGYGGYLELGTYDGGPGAEFNSSQVRDAMTARFGTELLFPVYDPDTSSGSGSNAEYNVIGWVAFHLTGFKPHGNKGSITGYFTDFIATDLAGETTPFDPDNDFGVRVITLTQ